MKEKRFILMFLFFFMLFLCVGCGENLTPTLEVANKEVELLVGETKEINFKVENVSGTDLIEYEIENNGIISINDDIITAISVGETKVTLRLKDYKDISAEMIVKVVNKGELTITGETNVNVNEKIKLNINKVNLDGEVVWSSSDPSIAIVENGEVTGVASGKATIFAKCNDVQTSIEITVVEADGIIISGNSIVYVNKKITLTAKLSGYSGEFAWESSDPTIATVSNGKVMGIAVGEVVITVKALDKVATFKVSVTEKPTISISGNSVIYIGKTTTLKAESDSIDGKIEWSSSNEKVATVDENGVVTGVSKGVITITASCNGITGTIKIKVTEEPDQVILHYNGGISVELYNECNPIEKIEITNYNGLSGGYWTNYEKHIFIFEESNDIKPTFSDRIYIGKNSVSGYYEIIKIQTSGESSWPDSAQYVITISSSYNNYKAIHEKVLNLKVGQVVVFDKKITAIDTITPGTANFHNKKIDLDELTIPKKDFNGLPVPTKLGSEFLGWYNASGEKIESLGDFSKTVELYAKWEELNPVTDISVNDIPNEMLKGDTFEINCKVIPDDAYFKDVLFSSSNEEVLRVDKNGKLTAINTGKAVITITDYVEKIKKEYEITVNSVPSVDVRFESETGEYNGYLEIGQEVKLNAAYFGKGSINSIKFTSNDETIATIDENGLVKANKEGVAIIKIEADTTNGKYEFLVNVLVKNVSAESKLDKVIKLIMENNFGVVEVGNACLYNDGTDRYYKATYGSVNRILFDKFLIDTGYVSTAENNKNGHKDRRDVDTIEFVTVHDTATLTGSAANIANNMATGKTSIHYAVGDKRIYGVVPEKYIAYHAGDGTTSTFQWNASGIKTDDNSAPKIGIVKDGTKYYFTINGEKTNLVAPISNGENTIKNPTNDSLTELGPVWKIENGEYYLGTAWVCFDQVAAGKICSHGGNNNSIGIEMCVNMSSDMYDTWQRTAMLVADICIRNNLDLTRVKQHNTWSGKNCPQDILAGSYWDEFMKMVEIQYILQKDYSDVVISMKSNNPDIVDNTGRVVNAPTITTTVSYEVTVSCGGETKTITLYSVVPGSTTWEQWNGTYSAKKIWNNGKFVK